MEPALGAEGGGDCHYGYDARTEEDTVTAGERKETTANIQAALGAGGLIPAAVGLPGGIGALLTKRAGYSRNA